MLEENLEFENVEEIEEETEEVEQSYSYIKGIVRSKRLALRTSPDTSSNKNIISELNEKSDIMVNVDKSTNEFYMVVTSSGIEGYCMKKFIEIT